MYTFLVDRRSLALLLTGAGTAVVVLFVAGAVIGRNLEMPPQPVAVTEFEQPPASGVALVAPVEPAPRPATREASIEPDTASSEPSDAAGGYSVQVGAWGVEETARRQRAALTAKGFESYIVPFRAASGRTLHAVRFGHFDNRQDALEGADRYLELVPGGDAIVRPIGPS